MHFRVLKPHFGFPNMIPEGGLLTPMTPPGSAPGIWITKTALGY